MVKLEPSPATDLTSMVPPIWSMLVRTTSMPTPRPETLVTVAAVEKPGAKMNLWICASVIFSSSASVARPFCDRLGLDPLGVEAAAVVGDADDDVAALVIGGEADGALLRLAGGAARSAGVSRPWSAELRTMWVSGSLIRSSTWRSSSVSAPCISSSICLPSSAERSRTMRGSFCQALPIGCMRVFMTPSCSSAVTLESRCSGTLNSESSWRRAISSSWLRVSTSSETMVIRCSSVSTLTRIDWLAILSASWTSAASATAAFRAGFALASAAALTARGAASGAGGVWRRRRGLGRFGAVSRNARSSSSSETSPGRSGRSSICVTSVPWRLPGSSRAHRRCGHHGAASTGIGMAAAFGHRMQLARSGPRRRPRARPRSASSSARISLMRSMVDRISVTASPVTGMPSRNLPISVSAACASASSRGRPRKPQVPLMVWTRRKMLSRILALFGSCSNRTS